ncbi:putative transcription factor interactor and regulator CCHC(Zn) family [Helianthus anomalus]
MRSEQRVERRTCFKCHKIRHIAWNCQQSNNTKQGVSFNPKLKEKHVDEKKQPTENYKGFENSNFEIGDVSKNFYKRKFDSNKQKWVVKRSDESSSDESDSIKSEELFVEKNVENSVLPLDDVNFPLLRAENLKSKGKFEISDQFFAKKKEFDVEKDFNGNVKHIFEKMVDGKVKKCERFLQIQKMVG